MNKRILLSAGSILFSTALLVGATYAFFTDTETSSGNTFTAGTLDLKVNGVDNPGPLVQLSAKPSESVAPVEITLTNTGSNGGVADLHFQNVVNSAGTLTEPECLAEGGTWDPTFTPPCQGGGWVPNDAVHHQIGLDIGYDLDGNGTVDEDEYLIWTDGGIVGTIEAGELSWGDNLDPNNVVASLAELSASPGFDLGPLVAVGPGAGARTLRLSFHLDDEAGNASQGDVSTFDILFTLHQANDTTSTNIVPSGIPTPEVSPTPTP